MREREKKREIGNKTRQKRGKEEKVEKKNCEKNSNREREKERGIKKETTFQPELYLLKAYCVYAKLQRKKETRKGEGYKEKE